MSEEKLSIEVVAAPLIVKNGKILLIQSHKWGDKYLIPGGHVEVGEKLEDAARREGEEETGLKLKVLRCVNTGELICSSLLNRKAHLIYFHFICEVVGGELKLDERELKNFEWAEPREALKKPLVDGVEKSIEKTSKIRPDLLKRISLPQRNRR